MRKKSDDAQWHRPRYSLTTRWINQYYRNITSDDDSEEIEGYSIYTKQVEQNKMKEAKSIIQGPDSRVYKLIS